MIEVSIVIVCMNNLEYLFPCLDSIKKYTTVSYEIFIIAYLFSKENLQKLKINYPWVIIIESNEIRGFSENNNLALTLAKGKYSFILNDDTSLIMNVIDQLVETFKDLSDDVAVVSPKILSDDESTQYCGRPKIDWATYLLSNLGLWTEKKSKSEYINKKGIFQTYNISGASFLIKTHILREMGFFDEYYFFCPEDIALSTKLNNSGYLCYVNENISIIHYEGQSGISKVSKIKIATLPAGEKGTIKFLANSSIFLWFFLSLNAFILSLFRYLFYKSKSKSKGDKFHIISIACLNVVKSIFSNKTPKEIFTKYYLTLNTAQNYDFNNVNSNL